MHKTFIIRAVGVTTAKKTIPITIGEIKLPSKIPNLNQTLLSGDKMLELNKPNNKKIIETIIDQVLKSSSLSNGYKEINKNKIPKTIPKLLLDEILIFVEFIILKFFHKSY